MKHFSSLAARSGRIGLVALLAIVGSVHQARAGDVKSASQIVVWNGERRDNGAGWSTPATETIYFKMQDRIARSGRNALEWRVVAKDQWTECGWEWLGWWPPTRGTDISSSRHLRFWIRVLGAQKPGDLNVSLKSPNQKRQLPTVKLTKYDAKFADGKWHRVKIPLRDMFLQTQQFDARKASQIFFGTWSANADFQVFIDDIVFE